MTAADAIRQLSEDIKMLGAVIAMQSKLLQRASLHVSTEVESWWNDYDLLLHEMRRLGIDGDQIRPH